MKLDQETSLMVAKLLYDINQDLKNHGNYIIKGNKIYQIPLSKLTKNYGKIAIQGKGKKANEDNIAKEILKDANVHLYVDGILFYKFMKDYRNNVKSIEIQEDGSIFIDTSIPGLNLHIPAPAPSVMDPQVRIEKEIEPLLEYLDSEDFLYSTEISNELFEEMKKIKIPLIYLNEDQPASLREPLSKSYLPLRFPNKYFIGFKKSTKSCTATIFGTSSLNLYLVMIKLVNPKYTIYQFMTVSDY